MEYLVLLVLVMVSAFNFAAEIAFVAFDRIKLKKLVHENNKKALLLQKILVHNPESFFSSILVVNNIVTVLAGVISAVIAIDLFGSKKYIIPITIIVTAVITLCDILAKTLAVKYPHKLSFFFIYPVRIIMVVLYPIVKIFSSCAKILFFLKKEKISISKEELKFLIKVAREEGVLSSKESEILHRIFSLTQKTVKEIMVRREAIDGYDIDLPLDELLDRIIITGHKRVPLYKNNIDNIIGVVYTKDLLAMYKNKQLLTITDCITAPFFVNEDIKLMDLLSKFQTQPIHLAIVRNKFQKTVGLIDLDSLFEQIVGEIVKERIELRYRG